MTKADGNVLAFASRPIAATLAVFTLLAWTVPPLLALRCQRRIAAMGREMAVAR